MFTRLGLILFSSTMQLLFLQCVSTRCPKMEEPPSISFDEESVLEVLARKGESITLNCTVHSTPQVRFEWFHNGKIVWKEAMNAEIENIKMKDNSKLLAMSTVQSRFHIPCADETSVGIYTCIAISPCNGLTEQKSTHLRVSSNPHRAKKCIRRKLGKPVITMSTVTRIEFEQNLVQLMCRVKGFPVPSVEWTLINDEDGRSSVSIDTLDNVTKLGNGDLLVTAPDTVTPSQTFQCIAHNKYGNDKSTSTVIYLSE